MLRSAPTERRKLKRLQPGATIGVFASGSATNPERVEAGKAAIEARGYRVKFAIDPGAHWQDPAARFFAASLQERLKAFRALLHDPEVSMLLAARGGYGSAELLPYLSFDEIAAARKAIVGFSDATILLAAIAGHSGLPAIHGPLLGEEFALSGSEAFAEQSVQSLVALLSDPSQLPSLAGTEIRSGSSSGPLLVGNLTMLQTLLGTPWDIAYDGAILVLEDVGERAYRIHRTLTHFRQAGKFERLAGVCFGRFNNCGGNEELNAASVIRESVNDIFEGSRFPILADLPVGHGGLNIALPVGCRAEIKSGALSVLESPIE